MNEPITDDVHGSIIHLFKLRLPWLILGLVGGAMVSVLVSRFEQILARNISLAFFLPVVVYLSDAVGTQTEALYIRTLSKGHVKFLQHLFKEIFVGLILGLTLGPLIGLVAWTWLGNLGVALAVGFATIVNLTVAPILAIFTSQIIYKEHADPALGAGPMATIIQDAFSLVIYFLTASLILGNFS